MKTRSGGGACITVFAALTIIGCCVSSIMCCQKRRVIQRKQHDEAVQNWEGEGGAVPMAEEDEDEVAVGALR